MNPIPDEKEIENMLKNSSPAVSPQLDQRLADAPWTSRNVTRRIYGAAFAVMAVMALSIAVTPQGRVLAQSVLQFFTRTESDAYYEPVSDLTFEDTTPFHPQCGIPIHPTCSVEQIRSMVDFEVKELGILPADLYFVGATGGPDWVDLHYEYPDRLAGGIGVLVERTGTGIHLASKSTNVESVQVGDLPAEYYTGILFQDENGNVTWQPNEPVAQLRWAEGNSTYTLFNFFQNQSDPLTKEELIAIAEGMTLEPVTR